MRSLLLIAIGVGRGVDATSDTRLDLAEADLVGDEDRGLKAGSACLLNVVGGGLGSQAAAEHDLTGEVPVAAVLEHGTGDNLAEALALELVAIDQAIEGCRQHVAVAGIHVVAVGAIEGDSVAAEDGGWTGKVGHGRGSIATPE